MEETPTEKRLWYVKTTPLNSLYYRNSSPSRKEENFQKQIKARNQTLVIRLTNNDGSIRKINVPVVINGRVKTEDKVIDYVVNTYRDIASLADENGNNDLFFPLILKAYNEWLVRYNDPDSALSPPTITNADYTVVPLAQVSKNDNIGSSISDSRIPVAQQVGRGKGTKRKRKTKHLKRKKSRKNKK